MKKKIIILIGIIFSLLVSISVGLAATDKQEIELTADKLVVDDLNSKVIAQGNVSLQRGATTIKAKKIIAQQGLKQLTARGQVVLEEQGSQLKGQLLKLDYNSQTGSLTGNPSLNRGSSLITGQRFKFNLRDNYLKVIGEAHLEDSAQDLVADADRIEYYQNKQEAILTGNVDVVRGKRQMTAPKVIVDLENKKMTTKGRTKFIIPQKQGD
ncbi:hypothetical protein JCM16358_13170 [Halanaerocella petrolearia]